MRRGRALAPVIAALLALGVASAAPERRAQAAALTGSTVAVIGDYGVNSTAEANVASLVASWNPTAVVTVGDNYYNPTSTATGTDRYDLVVGKYYCGFLKGAAPGPSCGGGTASENRFFPATGNHDYSDGDINNYKNYFALPGSELVYSQIVGDVEFFFIDSQACLNSATEMNAEKAWLQTALAASAVAVAWQVVVFHHPPYSSSSAHGPTEAMQWTFKDWGADLVLAGHDHTYERLSANGLTYVVDGLGGASRYSFGTPLAESLVRYNANWGALKLISASTYLVGQFVSLGGTIQDTFSLGTPPAAPGAFGKSSPASGATAVSRTGTSLSWGAATGGTTYEYCLDTKVNGTCNASWVSTSSTSAALPTLSSRKAYEWQVRAVNSLGSTTTADGGTWWRFTTAR